MKNRSLYVVLMFAGWIAAGVFYFAYKKNTSKLKATNSVLQEKQSKINYYTDRYGTEHARRLAVEGSYTILKNYYSDLLDSVSKRTKAKESNIKAVATAGVKSTNEIALNVDTVYIADSTTNYDFSYSDRWITLSGRVGAENTINYITRDSVVLTTFVKPSGLFGLGKKNIYVDGYSLNPHSRITGLQNVLLTRAKSKRWGIGIQAGYGWNGSQWAPYFGVGIQYSIVRF